MTGSVFQAILDALRSADDLYHRLVLLVGREGTGKTSVLRAVAAEFGADVVNANLELSKELLELTARQRILNLPKVLDRVIEHRTPPVILDNLEILFDKSLGQDPLRLLQGVSRNRTVLASWSGTFAGDRLVYAEPGHPEYRVYDSPDAQIVHMTGEASTDPAHTT